jgi:hypothetical protein
MFKSDGTRGHSCGMAISVYKRNGSASNTITNAVAPRKIVEGRSRDSRAECF